MDEIESKIRVDQEASLTLRRMSAINLLLSNKFVTITAGPSSVEGRRKLTISGPAEVIRKFEKCL